MKIYQYVANFLFNKGIKDVFVIEGSASAGLVVGVSEIKGMNYYCSHHEQAGSFCVDAYAKTTGKVAVMIATSGPGGQNCLNGIAASYYDSVPAIYITGQVNSRFIKPSNKIRQHGFQECDIVSMSSPITKYSTLVRETKMISYELEKAYHLATTGRQGPVLLDIPMDIQQSEYIEGEQLDYCPEEDNVKLNELSPELIDIYNLIKKSERPVILVGGGVQLSQANKLMHEFISITGIPFFVTWNMIDFCDNNNNLFGGRVGTYGGDGRNFGIQNADLLIAIGSRISGRITGGVVDSFARCANKVIVDIDAYELQYQQVKGDINIVSDAKYFLKLMINILKNEKPKFNFESWRKKIKYWKTEFAVFPKEYMLNANVVNPYYFIKNLSESLDSNAIMVYEAGGNCVVTSQAFEAKQGQRLFSNNGNSSLGYALPASIGASISSKMQDVICITGDGGMNFNIQELQTIKHHSLPIKIFIFNNYVYGITKAYRETNYNSNYAGVDSDHGISNPNFINIAKAYGIKAISISNDLEVDKIINQVLDFDGPVVCDVNMKNMYDYKPRLGWGVPIEEQYPFLDRKQFIQNMIIEPYEGWEDPVYPGKSG
jgi:acetolactate synthase I/II/III large subunit